MKRSRRLSIQDIRLNLNVLMGVSTTFPHFHWALARATVYPPPISGTGSPDRAGGLMNEPIGLPGIETKLVPGSSHDGIWFNYEVLAFQAKKRERNKVKTCPLAQDSFPWNETLSCDGIQRGSSSPSHIIKRFRQFLFNASGLLELFASGKRPFRLRVSTRIPPGN
jgi:hypothetical protein